MTIKSKEESPCLSSLDRTRSCHSSPHTPHTPHTPCSPPHHESSHTSVPPHRSPHQEYLSSQHHNQASPLTSTSHHFASTAVQNLPTSHSSVMLECHQNAVQSSPSKHHNIESSTLEHKPRVRRSPKKPRDRSFSSPEGSNGMLSPPCISGTPHNKRRKRQDHYYQDLCDSINSEASLPSTPDLLLHSTPLHGEMSSTSSHQPHHHQEHQEHHQEHHHGHHQGQLEQQLDDQLRFLNDTSSSQHSSSNFSPTRSKHMKRSKVWSNEYSIQYWGSELFSCPTRFFRSGKYFNIPRTKKYSIAMC